MRYKVCTVLLGVGKYILLLLTLQQSFVLRRGTFAHVLCLAGCGAVQPAYDCSWLPNCFNILIKRNVYLLCNVKRRLLVIDQTTCCVQDTRVCQFIKFFKCPPIIRVHLQHCYQLSKLFVLCFHQPPSTRFFLCYLLFHFHAVCLRFHDLEFFPPFTDIRGTNFKKDLRFSIFF